MDLSNNVSEQMKCRIMMNLKNAGNMGSENSAGYDTFMSSVIERCRMGKHLFQLLDRLKMSGEDADLTFRAV